MNKIQHSKRADFGGCSLTHLVNPVNPVKLFFLTSIDEITSKFDRLLAHPELGRSRHELLINLRSFPVRNYLIFYQPFVDGVEIFRVLHGSRELERVFDELIDRAN